ncbi:MAG: SBBP repeat-containing protein [Candidatus Kapabacteria bacterium]|nr:SBBP repeat-containing protein [Candidatus Kapabacteria bacterium]
MNRILLNISLLALLIASSIYAAQPPQLSMQSKFAFNGQMKEAFIENKGQIADQFGKVNNEVSLVAQVEFGNIYINKNSLSFAFIKSNKLNKNNSFQTEPATHLPDKFSKNEDDSIVLDIYRVDMKFNNANPNPKIIKKEITDDYDNYYLAQCPDGLTVVRKYRTVMMENIYPNIDFVIYSNSDHNFQYDFVIKPGADPVQINFTFEGADEIQITENGNLKISTPFGFLEQKAPISYQPLEFSTYTNSRKIPPNSLSINSKFVLNSDNSISFLAKNYNNEFPLIIDPPSRLWGTYYGGSNYDAGKGVAVDGSGNVYLTGQAGSTSAISTTGAHQVSLYAWDDAFLVKFNSNGVRQWGTYYGGEGADYGYGVAIDGSGNVYMAGSTLSSIGISTSGAHQENYNGTSFNAFLVKFNSTGVRQWGTYYAGANGSDGYCVTTDGSNNVYLTGQTNSTDAISTSGAHQEYISSLASDAYLVKFNNSGVRQWGTYYGGTGDERGHGIITDASGNIYLTGLTTSSSSISTTGSHQNSYGGGYGDAFLVKFNNNGVRQWGTYYGGNDSNTDYGLSLATDGSGNVYLSGITSSSTAIATSGAHQVSLGGSDDAFLVKFNSNGVRQWGTYYGGSSYDRSYGTATDNYGNVFIVGYTYSTNAISSSGAYKENFVSGTNAFLVKFTSSGVRRWGTYYGGSGSAGDLGYAAATDGLGNVFIAGSASSTSAIASSGAHQESFGGGTGTYDAFLVKFDSTSIASNAINTSTISPLIYCAGSFISIPFTITGTYNSSNTFFAELSDATGNFSSPTNIGNLAGTSAGTVNGTISRNTPAGTGYRVRVSSTNPAITGSDNGVNITVYSSPSATMTYEYELCSYQNSVQIGAIASGGTAPYSYTWTPSTNLSANNIAQPTCTPTTSQVEYHVTITDANGCTYKDSVEVVKFLPTIANAGSDAIICGSGSATIGGAPSASGPNGTYEYQWTPTTGLSSDVVANPVTSPLSSQTYTLMVTDNNGCIYRDTVIVSVYPLPNPTISGLTNVCSNSSNTYSANTGTYSYQWLVIGGIINGSSTANPVTIIWGTAGSGTVTLIETNTITGCSKSVSFSTIINPLPVPMISGTNVVCKYTTLSYTANTGTYSYQWSVTGGFINGSATNNPVSVTWVIPGSGTVTLIETNTLTGCSNTVYLPITINPLPSPGISGSMNVCEKSQNSYNSNSGSLTYQWSVVGGTFSSPSTSNPVIINWGAGPSGTLTIVQTSTITGCSGTYFTVININPLPKPTISGLNPVCVNSSSNYTVSAVSGHSYQWSAISGTFNGPNTGNQVNITWISAGSGTVKCIETISATGCKDSSYQTITIYPLPAKPDIQGTISVCVGNEYIYSATDIAGTTLAWSSIAGTIIGTNTGPIIRIRWDAVGTGFVKATRTNTTSNCNDSNSLTVLVHPLPNKSITGPAAVQKGSSQQYSGPSDASTWLWKVSSGGTITSSNNGQVVTIQWGNTGKEKITLYVTNAFGCLDSISLDVTISNSNIVITGNTNVCENSISVFSTPATPNRTNDWHVLGGIVQGVNTADIVTVKWGAAGTGNLSLIQTIQANQLHDTASIIVIINPLPKPKINGLNSAVNLTVQNYYATAATNNSYKWRADGGIIQGADNGTTVNILWGNTASGVVHLIQTSPEGCTDSIALDVTLNNKPGLSITGATNICEGLSADYKTITPNGATSSWSVSSIGTITGTNIGDQVTIKWINAGAGKITLIQEDKSKGFRDSLVKDVIVNPMPIVSINNLPDICLDAGKIDLAGGLPTGGRYSGLAVTANKFDPSVAGQGSHTITYTYTSTDGCTDSSWSSIIVHPLPAKPNITEIDSVLYSDAPSGNQWYYQDTLLVGATGTSYKPTKEGIYDVEVTDAFGCKSRADAPHFYPSGGRNPVIVAKTTIVCEDIICYKVEKDTLLIKNFGANPLTISSILINGNNKQEFALEKDYSGLTIDSMKNAKIIINFLPQSVGLKTANLIINSNATNNSKFNVDMTGSKDSSGFILTNNSVDFNNLNANTPATLEIGMTNTGSLPLSFNLPIKINNDFSITNISPNPLLPNSSATINIRYSGGPSGTKLTTSYNLTEPVCNNFAMISITATVGSVPVKGFAAFHIGNTEASPGEHFKIPLYMDSSSNTKLVQGYQFDLSFNKTLLAPINNSPAGIVSDSQRTITFVSDLNPLSPNLFKNYDFIAALGNDTSTVLSISNAKALGDSNLRVTIINGNFKLKGLCSQGGLRLLEIENSAKLMITKPNPGKDEIEIEYFIREDGISKLSLLDLAGKEIKIIYNKSMKIGAGTEKININDISNGTYFLFLQTQSTVYTKKIEIIK